MNNAFYERHHVKCLAFPKGRDGFYNGLWLTTSVKQFGNKNVVNNF